MKNHSDSADALTSLQKKLAGLGDHSVRKTYYPELQHRLEELERFKAFIDHSNDAMFLIRVPTGRIVDVNDSACRQMGWSRAEFLQQLIFDVSDVAGCSHADRLIRSVPEDSEERALAVTELHTKDGGEFPAELTLNRLTFDDGAYVLAVARDITERKRAEEALRQSEDFLKNIVDNIPAMVFAKEASELKYAFFNKGGQELLGYSREELLGRSDHDFFPEEQAAFFIQKDREVLAKGDLVEIPEETVQTRHGGDRILSTKKIPLFDSNGNARYLLGISEDITDRKRLEEQLLHSQKMDAIGQLASGVAHDFNNILMVIMGYCTLLGRDETLNVPQHGMVERIMDASEKASQLTRSLLTFSRKEPIKPRATSLNDIVMEIQEFLTRIIGEDLHLKSVLSRDNLIVEVDRGQVEQVLINLATNARDAMPGGGVLTIETGYQVVDPVLVETAGHGEVGRYAVVTVSDTGVGMDEQTRSRIFEPFFTTKDVGKGTGLGMAIVYGIVKQHNGFITADSEPGVGTSFRVYLPLVEKEGGMTEAPSQETVATGGTETILVVEDDPAVRGLVYEVLTGYGYEVVLAVDGEDAVLKFEANADRVRLILMDMVLPGRSGKEAFDRILKAGTRPKIIYTSGYTRDVLETRHTLESDALLLTKPIKPLELLRKIRRTLDTDYTDNPR